MMIRLSRIPVLTVIVTLAWVMAPSGQATAAAGAPSGSGVLSYTGRAYGTFAFVGHTVTLGQSAVTSLGACVTQAGIQNSNTVGSINAPPVARAGAIDTTAQSLTQPDGSQASRTTADVAQADLLDGLVTADEVKAESTTSRGTSGFATSADGSEFVNLVVAGIPVTGTPGPNTRIDLAGFGFVILNEQIARVRAGSATLTVNMVHVVIEVKNPLKIPVGTQLIVAHATSDLEGPVAGTLDGHAYATTARLGTTLVSGPSAKVGLGCLGTDGRVNSNSVASIDVPPLFATGTATDTATGTVTAKAATGETTSTIQVVDVGDGVITADVVTADAHSSTDGSTFSFSDAGSAFVNLVVQGHPEISGDPGPNTKVKLAGLGTLWLHRVIQSSNSFEVRMIELIVNQPNGLGIPVGTDIRVAVAEASAH